MMKKKKSFWMIILLVFGFQGLYSQISIAPGNISPYTPENLIQNVFLGDGVEITNVVFRGVPQAVGAFSGAVGDIGIDRGLVMSTGRVEELADRPASQESSSGTSMESITDQDIINLSGAQNRTRDLVSYEITFIPISDTIRFRYIFASEEYPQYVCSDYNDVFGFFITGPNPAGGSYASKNIALVPDPNDSSGHTLTNFPVSINAVNNGSIGSEANGGMCNLPQESLNFSTYYNNNQASQNFVLDGYLDVFTAQAIVIPCEQYTIKLAIADINDGSFDSAVFLEAKSFKTNGHQVEKLSLAIDGNIAEGCDPAILGFSIPNVLDHDTTFFYRILDSSNGNGAMLNADFSVNSNQVVIPAGQLSNSLEIYALEDNIAEAREEIQIEVQRDVCTLDTITYYIIDNSGVALSLSDDVILCDSMSYHIFAQLTDEVLPSEPLIFYTDTEVVIDAGNTSYISEIEVSGVFPEILKEDMITRICIDSLVHRQLDDLDIYVISPSGQYVELSTDNGRDGGNGIAFDELRQTCFTTKALLTINNGNAKAGDYYPDNLTYTGDFLPEGVFSDLWDRDPPSNGTWSLLIVDDTDDNLKGSLKGWSIEFAPLYDVDFLWSSSAGSIDCIDCLDIWVTPTVPTTYYFESKDIHNCRYIDSIQVIPGMMVSTPLNLACEVRNFRDLYLSWDASNGASDYELSLDMGNSWNSTNSTNEFIISGLEYGSTSNISIRAINASCKSMIATTSCSIPACDPPVITLDQEIAPSSACANDGRLSFSATGFSPFTYELNGSTNLTGLFDNLPNGNFLLTVTDSINCTNTMRVSLGTGNSLSILVVEEKDISCFGDTDGVIEIAVQNGIDPIQINWSNNATGTRLTSLSGGFYGVSVSDAADCTTTMIFTIDEPRPLEIVDFDVSNVACFGDSTGNIRPIVNGGTSPFEYNWTGIGLLTDATINNLPAGMYEVMIEDSNGCTTSGSTVISQNGPFMLEALAGFTQCSDSQNGTIVLLPSGGVMPLSFLWSDGSTQSNLMNKSPGMYSVTVTDAVGCEATISSNINSPAPILATIAKTDQTCSGLDDGQISLMVSGGTGQYLFEWNDGSDLQIRNSLAPGEYCVTIQDANACSIDTCLTISPYQNIEINAVVDSINCFGGSDGAIATSIQGGLEPFIYSWTGSNSFSSSASFISGVSSGVYTLNIEDASMCTRTFTFNLDQPEQIVLNAIKNDIKCKGLSTGFILTEPMGGQAPYDISWTGPAGYASTDQNIFNLTPGPYDARISDAQGCIITERIIITEPALGISAQIISNDTICNGKSDGTLRVMPTNGTPGYSYIWSNGIRNVDILNLFGGSYSVTVTDMNGCSASTSAEVVELEPINVVLDETPATCANGMDGKADVVSIAYGQQAQNLTDFSYQWNTLPIQSTKEASQLTAGQNYTVIVTDQFGCKATSVVNITSPMEIVLESVNIKEALCAGSQTGEIAIQPSGGIGPYSFQWDAQANNQVGATALQLAKGRYGVTVSDAGGCTEDFVLSVDEPPPLAYTTQAFDVACKDDQDGQIQINVSGGTPPYNYIWSTGDRDLRVIDLPKGIYGVTVTDDNDCSIQTSVEIEEPVNDLDFEVSISHPMCRFGSEGMISVLANGGNGSYTYSLDGIEYQGNNNLIGLGEGNYEVFVKDIRGCIISKTGFNLVVTNALSLDLGPDQNASYNYAVNINPQIDDGTEPFEYLWTSNIPINISCTDCPNPEINNVTEPFVLELQITDADGCRVKDRVIVNVEQFSYVRVPTAFTPNGDNTNDFLRVFGQQNLQIKSFRIYSRWGQLVHERQNFITNDESLGWDGRFKGRYMNSDTFVWIIEAILEDGTEEIFKGNTQLIR